ncbi:hypothetical protein IDJ76_19995 [Mucilaginibacter sp. ZB1P21]|uniref:Uncharacterized protein n=1 Tax=Mucilaginibacter glaciei TaxID=2772109 RepID=A0A926S2Q8_9SPHI|nr:hypothetical protein [Mucilaginibacter glaciei]
MALFFIALMDGPAISGNVWLVISGVLVFAFLLGIYLPFRLWSKRTTRWKLWAFDNVNNVHELKRVAVRANLYAAYGSFMDKLQIQSAAERADWRKLQERANFPEVFIDDHNVPPETTIYFSTPYLIFNMLLGLIFMGIGITVTYFSLRQPSSLITTLIGIAIILAPIYWIFVTLRDLLRHEAQIILNSKAIFTVETGFLSWDTIYDEEVQQVSQGRRGMKYTLHFNYMSGIANIDITLFATNRNQLEKLMRVYKGRFKNSDQ